MHANNPEARVILSVECDPDDRFLEEHPTAFSPTSMASLECVATADSEDSERSWSRRTLGNRNIGPVSYASAEFQESYRNRLAAP